MADEAIGTFRISYPQGAVFYAGQTVYGDVVLDLKQHITFNRIIVDCFGEVVSLRHHRFSSCFPHYNRTKILSEKVDLTRYIPLRLSQRSRHPTHQLVRLPFHFELPYHSSQSLECDRWGHVRYWCEAEIQISSKVEKIVAHFSCWRPFSVIENFHLGEFDWSKAVARLNVIESLHPSCLRRLFCCTAHGQVAVHMELNKVNFVPGENILVSFDVQNDSSIPITGVHLLLVQSLLHKSERTMPHQHTISRLQRLQDSVLSNHTLSRWLYFTAASESYAHLRIPTGETFSRNQQRLHIPSLPTSSIQPTEYYRGPAPGGHHLGPCSSQVVSRVQQQQHPDHLEAASQAKLHLNVSYSVVLVVCFDLCCQSDLLVSLPVWLGTIPAAPASNAPTLASNIPSTSSVTSMASSAVASFVESAAGSVWLELDHSSRSSRLNLLEDPSLHRYKRHRPQHLGAPTQYAPQYVYYPTIDLGEATLLRRGSSVRKSILKKKSGEGSRPVEEGDLSNATSQQSIQISWLSETSLNARFETPV